MANTVSYNMGQIRYIDGTSYMSDLNFDAYSVDTESVSGVRSYQDVVLYGDLSNSFAQNQSYYLRLGIPRNLSYNMTFDLKLLRGTKDNTGNFIFTNRNQYQEIKRFVVPRDSSNLLTYSRVVLYPEGIIEDGNPIVAIAAESRAEAVTNGVYYDVNTTKYFFKNGDTQEQDTEITLKNDVLLNHSWKSAQSDDIAYFDFIFSNKVSGESFNSILVELNRQSYDDDVSYEKDGRTYSGLYIDPDKVEIQCYQLINLISRVQDTDTFSNIGVWSHPDAIMSINGEEIRIGQSGYYELNDFDITNFGIVVKGTQDRFSLDYQYKISN